MEPIRSRRRFTEKQTARDYAKSLYRNRYCLSDFENVGDWRARVVETARVFYTASLTVRL